MPEMKIRKATMEDLQDLLDIEASALPNFRYMYDVRNFFLENDGNTGEMVIVDYDGVPAGMGQYSVMPDGSGWLETLRVRSDYQMRGVGKKIYERYMQIAEETKAPSIAMYTGLTNVGSRKLAESNGFSLAECFVEYVLELEDKDYPMPEGFREVTDVEEAMALIEGHHDSWGRFLALNRTWMHFGKPLYEYLIAHHMIYTDGTNSVVLGARMMEFKGWFIGWYDGDADKILAFAAAKTKEAGLPKITATFPESNNELADVFVAHGYAKGGTPIVEEVIR